MSLADGRATTYALGELQSRGTFFVTPGTDVYGGMVVGEHNRDEDLDVSGGDGGARVLACWGMCVSGLVPGVYAGMVVGKHDRDEDLDVSGGGGGGGERVLACWGMCVSGLGLGLYPAWLWGSTTAAEKRVGGPALVYVRGLGAGGPRVLSGLLPWGNACCRYRG